MYGFLTGSHAYGTPNDKSDVDLAVYVPAADADKFRSLFPNELRISNEGSYPDGCAYRFGSLNLLVFSSELHFNAWREATAELALRKPVTRSEAIKAIDEKLAVAEKAIAAQVDETILELA